MRMMLGETQPGNRTVNVPPWPEMLSPYNGNAYSLQEAVNEQYDWESEWEVPSEDAYSCDQFRMFEFKVRRCARGRSHDWTECPYAHPGEKARRRDPRKYHYSGTACPDFRKGCCKKGDACEYAHGVFECWLHPSRYRTQPCKDGTTCLRRVCFFAHTPHQLRLLPLSPSPFVSSPDSFDSPPMSPITISGSVTDIVSSLRSLQLNSLPNLISSPRSPLIRPGFFSLPSTPTPAAAVNYFDLTCVEEPVMERVESGRNIRTRMFQKLSKENSLDGSGSGALPDPDVDLVSELVTR